MSRFKNKMIVITGGTSGIGLAAAKRICEEEGAVAITGTSEDHLNDARNALPEGTLVLENDSADPDAAVELARAVSEKTSKIDGVFFNAGFGVFKPVEDIDVDHVDGLLNVNVRGPILQMRELKPILKDGAAVLITASVSPYLGQPEGSVYAATKAAVAALARSWAADLAGQNIRANSISPGPIDTNFFSGMGLSEEEVEEFSDQIKQQVALGRFGDANEVAAVATFLLSDDASYVSGSQYMVDGGMTYR